MKKLHKGFTVFELIITIAVIAALSAILIPSFVGLTSNTKVSADRSLVNMLNNSININFNETGSKPKTMHDAVRIVKKSSYTLDRLVTESDETLLFDPSDNFFHLSSDIAPERYPSCFAIYNSMPDLSTEGYHFGIYATENFNLTSIENLTVGFDVGYNTSIDNISYVGNNDVIIRTSKGRLNINSSSGTISHYGTASEVHIEEVSSSSYFEEGISSFIEVKKGRVVITPSSSVGGIHLLNSENNYDAISIGVVDEVSIPTLSRDFIDKDTETNSGTYDKYVTSIQNLKNRQDNDPGIEHVWVRFTVSETHSVPSAIVSSSSEEVSEIRVDQQTEAAQNASFDLTNPANKADAEEEAIIVVEPEILSGAVVRSGAIGYSSLDEAIEKSDSGKMITFLQNIAIQEPLTIEKDLIFNLNGKTISTDVNAITIQDCSLLVKDSSSGGIISGSASPLVSVTSGGLTIYSGTIKTTGYTAVSITNSSFVMSGGRLEGKGTTLKLTDFTICDISGGVITTTATSSSYYVLVVSSSAVEGATMLIHGTASIQATKGYGIKAKRTRIYETPTIKTKYYALNITGVVSIEGGTIQSTGNTSSIAATIVATTGCDLTISGGTITPKSGYKKIVISDNTTGFVRASSLSYISLSDITYRAAIYENNDFTPVALGACYGLISNPLCEDRIIKLNSDVNLTTKQYLKIIYSTTIDLNGYNITQPDATSSGKFLFYITSENFTIRGSGVVSYTENDALNATANICLFYIRPASGIVNTNYSIEGGTYQYFGNLANRNYFYFYNNGTGTNNFYFKGGVFGHSEYSTSKFITIRTSTIYKREYFYFTGGSFYGYDPANHGTSYKINIPTGYASTYNSETGYYDVGPTA